MTPRVIADFPCDTGENPLWHPDEQRIYWTDIPAGRLYRHDPATNRSEYFDVGAALGGFTLQEDGALLLFMAQGAVRLWRGKVTRTVLEQLPDEAQNRFNDVIADPEGRVFCGTMSPPHRKGRLYRLDPDGTITTILEGIGVSNGLGFTPDLRGLYYTDTPTHNIYRFDYDRATGAIENQRVFVHVPENPTEGHPDGMTVDAEGCIWSTRWGGYCMVRYDPRGNEMARIRFPAKNVSSVTFGGPDFTDMYVTSAACNDPTANGPHAGALFHVNLGIKGVPEFRSRIAAAGRP